MADDAGYALGIDLGTTYSAAAVARGDVVEVCTLGTTAPQIPSVVVLRDDGEILTGEAAERRAVGEPARTAREFKRRLGDPVPVIVGTTPYGAEALMAHLLRSIVDQVTAREGAAPAVMVLTHPANYSEYKQGLLLEAARLAGLDLDRVKLVTEPEAAAISYARQQRVEVGEVVAVYDFGGGTFDAAVVRKTDDGFALIGTPEGMERLGGIDVDQAVLAHVDSALDGLVSAADAADPQVRAGQARLREESRRAKEALSTDTDTSIPVSLPGVQTEVRLTRDELENMVRPRLAETVQALERAIKSAGVEASEVSRVLLVGGSSRIPAVAQLVRERTGIAVAVDAHPKFAIATGAALLGDADRDRKDPAAVAAVTTAPQATAPTGRRGERLAAGAVAAGTGFAATAGAAALVDGGTAGAAVTAGAGPAGTALGAAGPAGAPAAAGPSGTAASAGPGGTSLKPAAKVAKRRPRGVIFAGAAAGVALAAAAIVVTSGGGDGTATTVTTAAVGGPGTSGEPTATGEPVVSGARGLPGIVELVAGNGSDDSAGRPGPATNASLGSNPNFAVAPNGDVFVISPAPIVLLVRDGQISEIYTGGDGEFSFGGVAVGPDGDAYVTMSTGVKRISADGSSELVLDAKAKGLATSFGPIAFDGAGSFYFFDRTTYRVLRHAPDGSLSQVAGTGTQGPAGTAPTGDGGPATAAPLSVVDQLVIDGQGNLLIADSGQAVVRSVAADGTISTIAGGGAEPISGSVDDFAPDGTAATDLKLGQVTGVTVDGDGRVYVSDGLYHVIIRIEPGGGIEVVIGDQKGSVEEMGHAANATRATNVGTLHVDAAGNLVYLDSNSIRHILGATD
jgi:actin-like ATPase involved in cell morphogenesis